MPRKLAVAFFFVAFELCLSNACRAVPPVGDSLPDSEIEGLVERLAAPDFTVREAANQKLLELGDRASPFLERVLASKDPEQRFRAEEILRDYRKRSLWEPSRITLKRKAEPVLDVFREIVRQSGNPINWARTPKDFDDRIDVDFQGVSYWQAMDQLAAKVDGVVRVFDDPKLEGVVVAHRFEKNMVTYDGPLRVGVGTLNGSLSRSIPFGDNAVDSQEYMEIDYTLNWEQRLALCRYATRPKIIEARADGGEDLRFASKGLGGVMTLARKTRQVRFTSRLRPPSQPTKEIAILRIQMELFAAGDFRSIELPIEAGKSAGQAGYELSILNLKRTPDYWALMIRWTRPAPYDSAINATDMADEYLEILNASGEPIAYNQQQVIGDNSSVRYLIHASTKQGAPTKMRYRVGIVRGRRVAEFAFRDIKFPGSEP